MTSKGHRLLAIISDIGWPLKVICYWNCHNENFVTSEGQKLCRIYIIWMFKRNNPNPQIMRVTQQTSGRPVTHNPCCRSHIARHSQTSRCHASVYPVKVHYDWRRGWHLNVWNCEKWWSLGTYPTTSEYFLNASSLEYQSKVSIYQKGWTETLEHYYHQGLTLSNF